MNSLSLESLRLQVDRVESDEALRALEGEWRELESAAGNDHPFLTWEWSWSWWLHFREDKPALRDSIRVRTLREGSGRLVAIAPLMLTERPAVGPLRLRQLHFFGADPNVTEIRGMLCLPGSEPAVYGALADHLMAERDSWDWIVWSGILAESGAREALRERGELHLRPERPAFVLPLAPTWDEFRGSLKRNIKESLRKCYNSLKRDGHSFEIEVARDRERIPPALEEFLRLHSARALLDHTVPHADVFGSRVSRDFLLDVCQRLSDRGVTRIFLMRIGGEVVAVRIGFVVRDVLYLYYSGYDPEWSRYSVMTTTVAEAIRIAIEEGLSAVHLSTGRDVSKTRWGPEERVYHEAVQLSPTRRAALLHGAYGIALRAAEADGIRKLAERLTRRID